MANGKRLDLCIKSEQLFYEWLVISSRLWKTITIVVKAFHILPNIGWCLLIYYVVEFFCLCPRICSKLVCTQTIVTAHVSQWNSLHPWKKWSVCNFCEVILHIKNSNLRNKLKQFGNFFWNVLREMFLAFDTILLCSLRMTSHRSNKNVIKNVSWLHSYTNRRIQFLSIHQITMTTSTCVRT